MLGTLVVRKEMERRKETATTLQTKQITTQMNNTIT
jgi:hypothetical protein